MSSAGDPSGGRRAPVTALRGPAEWGARLYELAPGVLEDAVKRVLPFALPLAGVRVPIAVLRGTASFSPREATVVVAGERPSVDDLPDRFFGLSPEREELGSRAIWSLSSALRHFGRSAEWTVARVDHISARRLLAQGFLRVPESVGSWLDVPEDPAILASASHSVKEDMRIVRREQLAPELSRSPADYELFHRQMHVPFMRNRHRDAAVFRKLHQLRRDARRGGILFIRRGERRIAGVAFRRRRDTMVLVAVGTLDGDLAWVRAGAMAAIYWFAAQSAHEQGCSRIDFGGVSPVLSDGLLQYKRKWGIRLGAEPRTPYDYLVRWERPDALMLPFLARHPLIFRRGRSLAAVASSPAKGARLEDDAHELHRTFHIEGLEDLYVLADVPGPRTLMVPESSSAGGGRILIRAPHSFMQEFGLTR